MYNMKTGGCSVIYETSEILNFLNILNQRK